MQPAVIGAVGIAALFALILLQVPIGFAMMAVGVIGFALQGGWLPAFSFLAQEPSYVLSSTDLAAVPLIRLWITSDGVCMVIHVWDGSDEMPVVKDVSTEEENGRGLMLVAALGKDWGAYRKAQGKVVWVMVAAEP